MAADQVPTDGAGLAPDEPQPQAELAVQFAAVARALQAEPTVERTLARVTELAVSVIGGCDHAGITVVRRGRPETVAASDKIPARVDALQYQTRQGPCLDAITDERINRSQDLAAETRWPQFARRAVELTEVRSMLAYRLFTADDTLGALNLYSQRPEAFDDDVLPVGAVFAAHAAMAFANAREHEHITQLEQAVATNRRIGIAIGLLMAHRGIGSDEAFDLLRRASQLSNRKLRDIADEVVHSGDLPPADGLPHWTPAAGT
jgi:transcriptional regulator with GAF, ATPase, and Fis domain